jgi:hypothetical protein
MLGSGWKVLIVDEADAMSHKANQIWLSALEDLPPKSVIVFTTNNVGKFADRFVDRCQQIPFESDLFGHSADAQTLIDRIWAGETGNSEGAPRLGDLSQILDADGNLSYRRVIRGLEPLLGWQRASSRPAPAAEPTTLEPPRLPAVRTKRSRMMDYLNHCDWQAMAERFLSGEKLTVLARELGVDVKIVDHFVTQMGGTNDNRKSRRESQAAAG